MLSIIVVLLAYYPSKQRELLSGYKLDELRQQASSLSLSVEMGIKNDDLSSLQKMLNRLQAESRLTGVSCILTDSTGKVEMVNTIPQKLNHFLILQDSINYITVKRNFSTGTFGGYVMLSTSRDVLRAEISRMNRPIFIF